MGLAFRRLEILPGKLRQPEATNRVRSWLVYRDCMSGQGIDIKPDGLAMPLPGIVKKQEIAEELIVIFRRVDRGVKRFERYG